MTLQSPEPAMTTTFPGAQILIVDDERVLRHTLAGLFEYIGYQVSEAASGREALEHLRRQTFDVVILDLKMPEMDGTEVLKAARPLAPDTVFILLTAYGTMDSAIAAIRHGAFDYLLKPSPVREIFHAVETGLAERQRRLAGGDPMVLLERALNGLRSSRQVAMPSSPPERFLQAGDITVDTSKRLAILDGRPVELTTTEFDLLVYLMRHRERVVSCSELVTHLRGCEMDERDARVFLRSHVHRLRHKLEPDPAQPERIVTVRGSGYMLCG